jgi:hypothetical protein
MPLLCVRYRCPDAHRHSPSPGPPCSVYSPRPPPGTVTCADDAPSTRHLTSCRMYSIVSPTFPPAPSQFCASRHKQRTAVHRALTTYLTFKLDADTDSLPSLDTLPVGLPAVPHPTPLLVPVALTQPSSHLSTSSLPRCSKQRQA